MGSSVGLALLGLLLALALARRGHSVRSVVAAAALASFPAALWVVS